MSSLKEYDSFRATANRDYVSLSYDMGNCKERRRNIGMIASGL